MYSSLSFASFCTILSKAWKDEILNSLAAFVMICITDGSLIKTAKSPFSLKSILFYKLPPLLL